MLAKKVEKYWNTGIDEEDTAHVTLFYGLICFDGDLQNLSNNNTADRFWFVHAYDIMTATLVWIGESLKSEKIYSLFFC